MDVRARLARQTDRLGRLARAYRADAASLHAGGCAHRAFVPCLRRRTGRRADAACRRVSGDRRRDLPGGLHADRTDLEDARAGRPGSRSLATPFAGWDLTMTSLPNPPPLGARERTGSVAREPIACLGAGRMGRGIAVVFAYAGFDVALVDFKARDAAAFEQVSAEALAEVRN